MAIVINGRSLTGKTKLAELILKHMAKSGVFDALNTDSVVAFPMEKSGPKNLVGNNEAIIIEDIKDKYFYGLEFRKLTDKNPDRVSIKFGEESTINLKVSIFPNMHEAYSGICNENRWTILELKQLVRRVYFTFHLIGEPLVFDDDKPVGEGVKNRVFLTGDG